MSERENNPGPGAAFTGEFYNADQVRERAGSRQSMVGAQLVNLDLQGVDLKAQTSQAPRLCV